MKLDFFRKKTSSPSLPVFDGVSEIRQDGEMKLSPRAAAVTDIIAELLISVLSGWSFVHVFTSAFSLTVNELIFLPAVLVLSVIVLLIARDKKLGVFLFAGVIAAAVVLSIIRLQDLVAECTGIYDRLVSAFDRAYQTETDIHYSVPPDTDVTFIMVIFAVLPIWQTGYSYGRNIPPFIATAFLLIPLFLSALCLSAPGLFPLLVLLLCIILQFVLCRSECLLELHEMSRSLQLRLRFLLAASCVLFVLLLTAVCAYMLFPMLKKPFSRASDVYSRSSISDLLAKIEGNPFDISKPGMSGGDFSNVGTVVRNENPILSVSFSENSTSSVYLRGFTGDVYTGQGWEKSGEEVNPAWVPEKIGFTDVYSGRVDPEDANFRNPLLYVTALYSGTFLHSANDYNLVTIRETDQRDNYIYLPYFIIGGETEQLSEASFVGDLYLRSDEKERAMFQTVSYDSLSEALANASLRQYLYGLSGPSGKPLFGYEDLDTMIALLRDRYNITVTAEELLASPYTEYVFNDAEGHEIHMRLKEDCVSAYEEAMIQKNLVSGASARVKDLARELASEFQIDVSAMEIEKAVNAVKDYLFAQKEYSLNPGMTPRDTDFVEDFLFERESGYCVHFASAGTVLLRELGIPCRYVEGYLVPPAMKGEKVTVSDKDAHAWTEVFIRGFGWYPVEMTLSREEDEMGESEFTLETSTGTETEADVSVSEDPTADAEADITESGGEGSMPETGESPMPSNDASENEPSGQGDEKKEPFRLPSWFWPVVLSVLAAGALIALIIYLRYHIVPLEKLKGEDNKKTCRRIYDRIRRQAGRNGFRFNPDSSGEHLSELYPELSKTRLSEMQRIIKEVYYAKEDESNDGVRMLYEVYADRYLMRDPFLRTPSQHSDNADQK